MGCLAGMTIGGLGYLFSTNMIVPGGKIMYPFSVDWIEAYGVDTRKYHIVGNESGINVDVVYDNTSYNNYYSINRVIEEGGLPLLIFEMYFYQNNKFVDDIYVNLEANEFTGEQLSQLVDCFY